MKKYTILLIIFICSSKYGIASSNIPVNIIRMPPKQSKSDSSHQYLFELLKLAVSETDNDFGKARIIFMPTLLSEHFRLQLLNIEGTLDIATSAPTKDRETKYNSIRVPIFKGLLGYRMFLIAPKNKSLFQHITTPKQLKKLKACEETAWPDADILEANGYKVVRTIHYADLFKYLSSGKCDYFPRGIIEGYGELKQYNIDHPTHKLASYDHVLLHYFLPLFFYTGHQNFVLSTRIELGLQRANKDGKLLKLMKSNKVTAAAFPLSKWKNTRIFSLKNPSIVKSVPTYDKKLWLTLPSKSTQFK